MAYLDDKDLEFLKDCSNNELEILVNILTKDKDGITRPTESLTFSQTYIKNNPNHCKYWDLIAAEIQCFGANTFATMLRGGKGVPYREVLIDVCDKMDVGYKSDASTQVIEMSLLLKIFADATDKMSLDDLKEISKDLELKTTDFSKQALVSVLQSSVRLSGITAYKLTLIVANAVAKAAVGHGLSFTTNMVLLRTLSIATGPIGWVISGCWTALGIAGPAFRITIPSIVQIAHLRLLKQQK